MIFSPRKHGKFSKSPSVGHTLVALLSLIAGGTGFRLFRNFTDRKAAEKALNKSRKRYRALVENMLDGFACCQMLFDDRGRPIDFLYLEVNDAFLRLTEQKDVIGRKFSELFPGNYAGRQELIKRYSRVAITGNSEKFEHYFAPLSLWLDLSVASPERGYILIVFKDITERKVLTGQRQAALDLLQNITDRVPGVVFQCRLDDRGSFSFPFISQGLREIYRLSPEEVHDEATIFFAAHHPDDQVGILETLHKSGREASPWAYEYRLKLADGTERWLSGSAMPQRAEDGSILWHGVITDITERMQAEEQLRTLNEELERRVEQRTRELQETQSHFLHVEKLSAIGKLSASIAHEFNSPLQAVMTVMKGLQLGARLDDEDRKLLEAAHGESERMKNLIRSLQDFNRPSSGRKVLMDVHASIDSLLLLYKSDFNRKNISIELHYAERFPQIMAIPDQIKQVFLNLLNNAADACLRNGGVITINTWQEGERVAVAIRDTGVGIPPDKMDLIFQPFYTTKPEIKGTGLGLSVCHGIVQKHQGEIRVESQPGQGTTFTVLLPIHDLN